MTQRNNLAFNRSNNTTWLFSLENPCLARFGHKLFEIDGEGAKIFPGRVTLRDWRNFCSAIQAKTDFLPPDHAMPLDLWRQTYFTGARETLYPSLQLDVETIKRSFNPFDQNPWQLDKIQETDVLAAIDMRDFAMEPVEPHDRQDQIRRIAYLATTVQEWDPIELQFDQPGRFMVRDGHHRLAAAIVLKHTTISAIYEGFFDLFSTAFPTAAPDLVPA